MCPKFPSKLIKYLHEYIIFFKTYNITYGTRFIPRNAKDYIRCVTKLRMRVCL